jgi:hypothetical protein
MLYLASEWRQNGVRMKRQSRTPASESDAGDDSERTGTILTLGRVALTHACKSIAQ